MKLLVVSDIHFAGAAEQARRGHEARAISNRLLRSGARAWRHWVWLRDPLAHNHRLGRIIALNPNPDLVVANGDFTLDSAFVGVSDDAARASAGEALEMLRTSYGDRLSATIGDHELGKQSLFGGAGGPRLESWRRCVHDLGLKPVWRRDVGRFVLLGVASTVVALPVFAPEFAPDEAAGWEALRSEVMTRLREELVGIGPDRRLILFVHDPSALPFLAREAELQRRLRQVEATVVGHLHTPAVFWLAGRLAGLPRIGFLGNTVRRYTAALREARGWSEFRVVLCPSPTGIELLKDGGWLEVKFDPEGGPPLQIRRRRLPW